MSLDRYDLDYCQPPDDLPEKPELDGFALDRKIQMSREERDRKDWEDYQRFESWREHQRMHS